MASEIKIHLSTYLKDAGIKATQQQVDALAKKVAASNKELQSGAEKSIGSIGKMEGPLGKLQDALGGVAAKAMSFIAAFKIGWDIGTFINDKVITPLFGITDPVEELKKRNKELKRQAEEAAEAWESAFKSWEEGFRNQVDGIDRAIQKTDNLTAAYLRMQQAREKVQKAGDDAALLGLQRDKFNDMATLAAGGNAIGAAQAGKYYDVLIAEEQQKQKLAKYDRDAEAIEKRRAAAQETYNRSQQKVTKLEKQLAEAKAEEARLDTRKAVEELGWEGAEAKYQKAVATRQKLEKDLAKAQDDRSKRRTEANALNIEATAAAQERDNIQQQTELELDEKKKAYDEYLDYVEKQQAAEAETQLQTQQDAARKAVEAEAQERRKMEAQLAQQRIADIKTELTERQRAEQAAASRQSAAGGSLATAWGWYRNQASMQAVLDERKAQADAEVQWAKDFDRLKSRRRDWRTAEFGSLSAADESVRQVALAKEEKEAADRAVIETAENTRQLAAKLDELLQVKG